MPGPSERPPAGGYPPVEKDDSVTKPRLAKRPKPERRSFEAAPDDGLDDGLMGPRGDPAEGKR